VHLRPVPRGRENRTTRRNVTENRTARRVVGRNACVRVVSGPNIDVSEVGYDFMRSRAFSNACARGGFA